MSDDITYNQISFLTNDSFTSQTVKKSFIEKGKLILIIEDSKKITISGKRIDASGNRYYYAPGLCARKLFNHELLFIFQAQVLP